MNKKKAVRRRGTALDDAILASAWEELQGNGYINFTMEAVAQRAGTSRSVLARRWQSRAELAVAAINYYRQQHLLVAPDLGNVRDELATLLQQMSERSAPALSVLLGMRDYFEETNSTLFDLRSKFIDTNMLELVLNRAIERGEIDPTKLTKRIASLPVDLVRSEGMMTHQPVPRTVIIEILDTIFLPLVTPDEN